MTTSVARAQIELPITDPVLIVAVAALVFLVAPLLAERLRAPGLIGLILAGAVLGPNALNVLARSNTIILLGTVGLLYLMFQAAIEIDLHEFRRHRTRSLTFGAVTFLFPQVLGTGAMMALGYSVPTSILIASMFASHTLVAYPIVSRFRIIRNPAITVTLGATMIANVAALLVLAVIAASTEGQLDAAFWIQLTVGISVYTAAVLLLLPRAARWFFRHERTGAVAEYVFVFTSLFAGSYLAGVAGMEPIVGAFLVGVALNRLIPEQSLLANRIHFVGEAIFIPFFLLSVGMLVDPRALVGGARVWQVMITMTVAVTVTKWLAAWLSGRLFGYSRDEWWTMFGLSVSQAAATLAAAIIGVELGLFDDAVLNGTILMILVTCVVGPPIVERFGRRIALAEERKPMSVGSAPQRILVPMANPANADALVDLATAVRRPDSSEPLLALTVVPADPDKAHEPVALAERMLSHAVSYAAGADVPVLPITRVDHNFANGIARAATETRSSIVIIGWDARRSTRHLIFGTVLDQLLDQTTQQVIVAKLGHPLNTTGRLLLLIPRGSDRIPGFGDAIYGLKLMANRLGASIEGHVIAGPAERYLTHLSAIKPEAPVRLDRVPGWEAVGEMLHAEVRPNDLVVLLSARRGAVSWHPALGRIPTLLAELAPESFLVIFPSEARPASEILPRTGVAGVQAENVVVDLKATDFRDAIPEILATAFAHTRLEELSSRLVLQEEEFTTEIREGVVVPHLRIGGLERSIIFLGVSRLGVRFPHAESPAHVIFILLTPEAPADEHLNQLAEVARLVKDDARIDALRRAESAGEMLAILACESPAKSP